MQKFLLALNEISPKAVTGVEWLVEKLVTSRMEKPDTDDADPYGHMEDIIKGQRTDLAVEQRYYGILRGQAPQHAWGKAVHRGSLTPDRDGAERFGTYDVAKKLGFTHEQAKRIGDECNNVDTNETHYRDPHDPSKRRISKSGAGGKKGDFHWHFNRSPDGVEDSRITAAKIHLDRAVTLAGQGYFEAAERELGVGMHSLQDIFAHSQITPLNHALLGEFPDFVKFNPIGMYEAAQATEGYLKAFASRLGLSVPRRTRSAQQRFGGIGTLVAGDATPEEKFQVGRVLSGYPEGRRQALADNGIQIFVGALGTQLTDHGFGDDIDGDGVITPGKWVDINGDGKKQDFEVEDRMADGRSWNDQRAGYSHDSKTIFISTRALANPAQLDAILKHEIRHAIDLTFQDDPQLGAKWSSYIGRLYESARRHGDVAFDELDAHELFAGGA